MAKIKETKQEKKTADIVVLDEGITKKGIGIESVCCCGSYFPIRG